MYLAKDGAEGVGCQEQPDHRGAFIYSCRLGVEGEHFLGLLPLMLAPSGV